MILKWRSKFITISAFFWMSCALQAETIGFPRENPVFTIELPKNYHSEFASTGSLRITTSSGRYLILSEMNVHDKEAARKFMEKMSALPCNAKGANGIELTPAHEIRLSANLIGIETSCAGEVYAGLDKARIDMSAVAFSLGGNTFFELSGYSFNDYYAVQQIAGSIKPATPAPMTSESPKK